MNFFQKFRDFIVLPTQSRTMALVGMLVLVSAVSLTVMVAQQQQTLKQRASGMFDLGQITATPKLVTAGDKVTIEVPIGNTRSGRDQDVTVRLRVMQGSRLWYSFDQLAEISRPVTLLSGFNYEYFDYIATSTDYSKRNVQVDILLNGDVDTGDEFDGVFDVTASANSPTPAATFNCGASDSDESSTYQCITGTSCPTNFPHTSYRASDTCNATNGKVCCYSVPSSNLPAAPAIPTPNSSSCETDSNCPGQICIGTSSSNNSGSCVNYNSQSYDAYCAAPDGTAKNTACKSGFCDPKTKLCSSAPPGATGTTTPTPIPTSTPLTGKGTISGDTVPTGATLIVQDANKKVVGSTMTTTPITSLSLTAGKYTFILTKPCYENLEIPVTITANENNGNGTWILERDDTPIAECSASSAAAAPASPTSATLALTLSTQDISSTSADLRVNLTLYNSQAINALVTGVITTPQLFTKTDNASRRQYSASAIPINTSAGLIPNTKYIIIAKKGNLIAKSSFTYSGQVPITAAPSTLVFGDLNNDNNIDLLDYNMFKACWRKPAAGACASSSFDGNKNKTIDQIDFNALMKGWAIWSI